MSNKQIIGFDADDTLWENEVFFHQAQMKFIELHPHIKDPEEVILQIEKEKYQVLWLWNKRICTFVIRSISTILQ